MSVLMVKFMSMDPWMGIFYVLGWDNLCMYMGQLMSVDGTVYVHGWDTLHSWMGHFMSADRTPYSVDGTPLMSLDVTPKVCGWDTLSP